MSTPKLADRCEKPQKYGTGWVLTISAFILGAIAAFIIETILDLSLGDWIKNKYKQLTAPVTVDFVARPDLHCESGDVGAVMTLAKDDLLSGNTIPEQLASNAFVCSDFSLRKEPPLMVLRRLDKQFPNCFTFIKAAAPPGGGEIKPRFQLSLGKGSHICVAPLGKNPDTNSWEMKKTLEDGRVFCLGNRTPSGPKSAFAEPIQLCAVDDLSAYGFSKVLTDTDYGSASKRFSQ